MPRRHNSGLEVLISRTPHQRSRIKRLSDDALDADVLLPHVHTCTYGCIAGCIAVSRARWDEGSAHPDAHHDCNTDKASASAICVVTIQLAGSDSPESESQNTFRRLHTAISTVNEQVEQITVRSAWK